MTEELPPIDPTATVVLVLDAQPATSGRVPDRDAVVANIAAAIAAARSHGIRVSYVRSAFTDEDYAEIPPTNKLLGPLAGMAAQRPLHDDDPATAVLPELAPQTGEIVARKTRIGAFSTGDLGERLDPLGIDTVVLTGFSTSGVVLSTLREAIDHDARVIVLADAIGDPQPDVHAVLTQKVFPTHAWVITTQEFTNRLS
jgi:nicotinamidase-related amidase